MKRIDYQNYLEDTSFIIREDLKEISEKYDFFNPLLSDDFKIVFDERLKYKLLKPTLFRLVYQYSGGKNFNSIKSVALAFELINISSYQANSSFDNKICAYDKEQKDLQFISSYLTREIANQLILELQIESQIKEQILFEFSKINENIYLAQHLDLNVLTINNYQTYQNNYSLYWKDYKQRCELGSGYFSGSCAKIASIIANKDTQESNLLFDIFNKYGTLLHMINDLGDYLPNEKYRNKPYQDNLSDFKNGRLTLPLLLLLNNNSDIKLFNEDNIVPSILPYLIQTKELIVADYKLLKREIKLLKRNQESDMIKILLSTIKSNKFFNILKTTNGNNP